MSSSGVGPGMELGYCWESVYKACELSVEPRTYRGMRLAQPTEHGTQADNVRVGGLTCFKAHWGQEMLLPSCRQFSLSIICIYLLSLLSVCVITF